MDPSRLAAKAASVNHSLPSGPFATPAGALAGVGVAYSLKEPAVLTDPIRPAPLSANQKTPPGPDVISVGEAPGVGITYSVRLLSTLSMLPTLLLPLSVNQSLVSLTIPQGAETVGLLSLKFFRCPLV